MSKRKGFVEEASTTASSGSGKRRKPTNAQEKRVSQGPTGSSPEKKRLRFDELEGSDLSDVEDC